MIRFIEAVQPRAAEELVADVYREIRRDFKLPQAPLTGHPRVRRRPAEAMQPIRHAAEELLIEAGPRAVQVRAVAQRVAMTDAGVAHHFGSRDR